MTGWAENFGKVEIRRRDIPRAREYLMYRFGIEPETVPAMAVRFGRNRVSFVPIGLWLIGSNGRVNITTDKNRYILLDLGGDDGEPSRWTVVNPSERGQRISFDQNSLAKLMKDESLFP